MYVNTHSYYSLRYGTFSPATLLQLAQENGCKSIALTDINTTSACLEFIREAPRFNIKPVIGVDFRNGVQQQFILLAKNNKGFYRILMMYHEGVGKKLFFRKKDAICSIKVGGLNR